MCTSSDAPGARSIGCPARVSVWLPAAPVSENADAFTLSAAMPQVTGPGVPPGSGSDRVTPCAVPVPLLVIVTLNPICSPALTDGASAVFKTVTDAGLQAVCASEDGLPSLVVVTLAV